MRPGPLASVVLMALATGGSAVAQSGDPPAARQAASFPTFLDEMRQPPLTSLDAAAPPPVPDRLLFDVLVGLPIAVRGQVRLTDNPASALFVEAFLGAEIILPTAGVGIRKRFTFWDDGVKSFSMNPGVDVYGIFLFLGGGAAVVGDVDLIWNKRVNGGSVDFGVKLGAGLSVTDGLLFDGSRTGVLPVATLIFGRHY